MRVPWLKGPIADEGPFLSIHLDTTRTDPSASAELATRWSHMRTRLSAAGAPSEILDEIADSVLSPSSIGGRHGRTIIASPREILLDRVLPVPPREDAASFGETPMLLPLLQLTPLAVSQLLIEVDRAGADLHLRAPEDPSISTDGPDRVDGGHDELHKASVGGGSQHGWRARNFDARVEDSWERNAEAVGRKVDALVERHKPDMVLLTGDVRATALLQDVLGQEARARLHLVSGGTRGQSMDRASFRDELERVTREFIDRREQDVADQFHENQLRGGTSVAGVDEVTATLRRGQVDQLVFTVGQEPEGIEELFRQAITTDAGVCALEEGYAAIPEGVGALLRWRDEATPSNELSSMSGDPRREDAVPERGEETPHEQEEHGLRA
ncbi:hypothetical protein BRM3_00095 [Brachybacterium huguangmaarense]|uniref:Peptide chain release factor 1 n=1 Tax=Brachybacterium huguangmaarense TaxID=1652028 RepID=A0ABY6G116_9MICO|nr:hypothetical protein [Brachybacterium huguangmaarense]UYG16883.1 hypothetical protein BRM3_00095 [Brachybacterium huguangmaarense]